jgi:hypothetical protein
MRGTRSSKRTDLPQKIITAIFRCPRFCWYSNPRSTVRENVELRGLSCGQELTVLKSREASIPGGLTFVPGEIVAQSFAHTLVEEDAHFMPGPTAAVELPPARRRPSRVKRSDTLRQILQACGRAPGNRTKVGGVLASREKPEFRSGYLDF